MDFIAYKPAVFVAGVTESFSTFGLDATKVLRIYEEPALAGGAFRSFDPTRFANSLLTFTTGRGYLLYPKANFSIAVGGTGGTGWDGIVTLS